MTFRELIIVILAVLAIVFIFHGTSRADEPTQHKPFAVSVIQKLDLCTQQSLVLSALIEHAKTVTNHEDWKKYVTSESTYANPRPDDAYHQLASIAWEDKDEDSADYGYAYYTSCKNRALLETMGKP